MVEILDWVQIKSVLKRINIERVFFMDVKELYRQWCQQELEDADLTQELEAIASDEDGIFDRFYQELDFGTAGLRGVIGAGTNRMNIYTVRKATQGIANYLTARKGDAQVAIAYDSRNKSQLFARETACVFAANGIRVHLYEELMPTPMLSFAVRQLHCDAGVVITASHNPAKYNGYKAYGSDGCQIDPEMADEIMDSIGKLDTFRDVKTVEFDAAVQAGTITYISQDVIEAFYEQVLSQSVNRGVAENSGLKLVYTPLNGTGNKPVREILRRIGVKDVAVVKEQEYPDGNFPTCPYPNPEIRQALEKGLALCKELGADMLLATDPDCDRVGIAVRDGEDYRLFTGNEVGVLLLYYIASCKKASGTLPKDPICVKTIVTTKMIDAVAADFGVEVRNVLTGFKFIGGVIAELEAKGEEERYLLGFEESYGYLTGGYVRDKDAVDGAMMIVEMASYYKAQGKLLTQVLDELYEKYGYYLCSQESFAFEGAAGMAHMAQLMDSLRANPLTQIAGTPTSYVADYKSSKRVDLNTQEEFQLQQPKANVLEFGLADGSTVIVRPSGTEPKIKVYYFVKAADKAAAQSVQDALRQFMGAQMK